MSLDAFGLQKTSVTDYPGTVAAVLFTHGCNMACPWCHNGSLVRGPRPADFVPRAQVMDFLRRRRGVLGGVVVTGGEPLLHEDLPDLLDELKALGYPVKLDTNGSLPEALERVSPDYVAMDLKLPPLAYARVGYHGAVDKLTETIAQLRRRGLPHEFRTVWVPTWSRPAYIGPMARALGEGAKLYVAAFRPGTCLDPSFNEVPRAPEDEVREVVAAFRAAGVDAHLRGWE